MTIKFKEPLGAQACVIVSSSPFPPSCTAKANKSLGLVTFQKMHGRFFAGRQVIATLFDGKAKFRRSGVGADEGEEDGDGDEGGNSGAKDEEKKRLDAFGKWLESGAE